MDRPRFSSFDALKGFRDAVASRKIPDELPREIVESDLSELNRRLTMLQCLTANSRLA